MALLDTFNSLINFSQIRSFEDTIIISDLFSSVLRIAPILNITDIITLTDIFTLEQSDRYIKTINEVVTLIDTFIETHTLRESTSTVDTTVISDTVVIQTGIKVINGTGTGAYDVGEQAQLGPITPENKVFYKWDFSKSGISNIYDPTAIVTIPINGGLITGDYLDLLPGDNSVIVIDPLDFEYVDNGTEDDEVLTNETAKSVSSKMGVASNNIEIPQGSRYYNIIVYKDNDGNPVDLTGYTAEMQIRAYKGATASLLTLNTSNGYLALGGAAGTITIDIPGDITEALDFNWARYDLELYPAGVVADSIRLIEGKVHLNKEVTR